MKNIFFKSCKNDIHVRQKTRNNEVQKEICQKNGDTNTQSVVLSTNKTQSLDWSQENLEEKHNYLSFKFIHGEDNMTGTDRSDCQTPIQNSRVMFSEFENERAAMEGNCDLLFHDDNDDSVVDNFSVDSENGGLE